MAKQWAKIYRDAKDSDRLTALLAKNPMAEALYWRLKAVSDDFGRFLGDPADVGAAICPRNLIMGHFKLRKIEQALADMEECKVIRLYEVGDGKHYLEITDYHYHAHDQWTSVGKPEYPAPLDWCVPEDLKAWIVECLKNPKATNITPERFGITEANWQGYPPYPWGTPKVPTPEGTGVGGGTDSDVDSDVDGDREEEMGTPPTLPSDTHLLTCNDPFTAEVQRYFCTSNPPVLSVPDAQAYAVKCKQLCGVGNADFTEADLLEAITHGANGPTPGGECDVRFGPQKWVDRLRREKQAAARASPGPGTSPPEDDRSKFAPKEEDDAA